MSRAGQPAVVPTWMQSGDVVLQVRYVLHGDAELLAVEVDKLASVQKIKWIVLAYYLDQVELTHQ